MEVSPVRHVSKFQTSTRKTDMQHKPCCSYKWMRHNESLLSGNDENFQNASSQKPAKSQPCKQSQVYYMNQFLHKSLTHWLLPLPRTFFPQKSTFHSLISSRWYQISHLSAVFPPSYTKHMSFVTRISLTRLYVPISTYHLTQYLLFYSLICTVSVSVSDT